MTIYVYAQILGITSSDISNNPISNNKGIETTNTTNNSAARSSDSLTYENNQYGYTIGYPSDWTIHESTVSPDIEKAPRVYLPSVSIRLSAELD